MGSDYGTVFDRRIAETTALQAIRDVDGTVSQFCDYSGAVFESDHKRTAMTDQHLRAIIAACRQFECAMVPILNDIHDLAAAPRTTERTENE